MILFYAQNNLTFLNTMQYTHNEKFKSALAGLTITDPLQNGTEVDLQ